jgi:hypothetical protein
VVIFLPGDGARGQQEAQRMGIIHGNQVLGLRIRFNTMSSPSGVVEIEVSKYNVVHRRVLERKMKQGKYIFCVRGDRNTIR